MCMDLQQQIDAIVKFVTSLYSPTDVWVKPWNDNPNRYSIIFYFDEIDDKYITNSNHRDPKELKAKRLTRDIRDSVYNFFDIRTSGLQPPDYFSPQEEHPLSIVATYTS